MEATTAHLDANRLMSEQFAKVFTRAYLEISNELQDVVKQMCQIAEDPDVDVDDRESALITLTEALFPSSHDGDLGIDISALRDEAASGVLTDPFAEIDEEDTVFGHNLKSLMSERGINQSDLANQIGVGQPAISMMLSRQCHPQRRTIKNLADALGVDPTELLPSYSSIRPTA